MPKRRLEDTPGMHPSNPYRDNPPDFAALAELYPSLKPFVTIKTTGSKTQGTINFRDPMALRELTYCLLRRDFSIELDIPIDSLCPAVPNRVNYVCWIEDLMSNNSQGSIRGIDIGTGASCIYPLLGCTRNKNWKMVATDIDDRSISYATENVARNNLYHAVIVVKNTSSLIFPDPLFKEDDERYDFCMCNPPFYEDEQDIQDSLEDKEYLPSATCQGTPNEMITAGGEVQFVKQMIDESRQWQTRIRWYTSMLGKKDSMDKVAAYLKESKILNYTLTTFRQGRTSRWALAWSFGDEHASWASIQHTPKKMIKLAPPVTALSFNVADTTLKSAVNHATAILDRISVDYQVQNKDSFHGGKEPRVFRGSVRTNTWSRAARRALARKAKEQDGAADETATIERPGLSTPLAAMAFELRIFPPDDSRGPVSSSSTTASPANTLTMQMTWTVGQDRDLFESFFLHFRTNFLQRLGPSSSPSDSPINKSV
ncbi:hypothetical protein BC939DRAFT_464205 [Gamsiella multidivaricata]|uniref:uncharacterized protein n=1 Tax=Gamsiella multidivaricata TaxID=101098 RepID=UPI0022211FD1|nr:uncharacterized protein BC939DRAFT_464205 [Gamsiella multidivaricata]KAI7818053.1 hypothetical protein BC939DRAFT_464205 [Gamsiella multidivaricata]